MEETYEEIEISYVNGNKQHVVEQLETIDIPDFLNYLKEKGDIQLMLDIVISYFTRKR